MPFLVAVVGAEARSGGRAARPRQHGQDQPRALHQVQDQSHELASKAKANHFAFVFSQVCSNKMRNRKSNQSLFIDLTVLHSKINMNEIVS